MTTPASPGSQPSIPQVFDEIAELARQVEQQADFAPQTFSQAELVLIEKASPCQRVGVSISAGRIESLRVAPEALQELGWQGVAALLVQTVNAGLDAAEQASLEQLSTVSEGFADLLQGLDGLQTQLHAAYLSDVEKLG